LSLKSGDPVAALAQLQDQVRAAPADPKLRIFLFQLLCVLGQWERALNQLNVASSLSPDAMAMAQTYDAAVRCEAVRSEVFEGKKSPMIFGQPEQWLALLIESLLVAGRGDGERSHELRASAFAEAPTSQGDIDGRPFTWIADADSRLGPVLEAVINGRYYWVPFSRLAKIELEPPSDLLECLADEPAAMAYFRELPKSHQNYFGNWVKTARTPETRAKRIARVVTAMLKKQNYGEMIRAGREDRLDWPE